MKKSILLSVLFAGLLVPTISRADTRRGAFRIATESWVFTNVRSLDNNIGDFTTVGLAPFGVASLGYQLDDNLVLGARLAGGLMHTGNTDVGLLWLQPYAEYMFMPSDSSVRPFLNVGIGMMAAWVNSGSSSSDAPVLNLGGGGGVHFFLTRSFSISPAIQVDYVRYFGKNGSPDVNGLLIEGAVRLSGWIS